jgi:hypothetical protein
MPLIATFSGELFAGAAARDPPAALDVIRAKEG